MYWEEYKFVRKLNPILRPGGTISENNQFLTTLNQTMQPPEESVPWGRSSEYSHTIWGAGKAYQESFVPEGRLSVYCADYSLNELHNSFPYSYSGWTLAPVKQPFRCGYPTEITAWKLISHTHLLSSDGSSEKEYQGWLFRSTARISSFWFKQPSLSISERGIPVYRGKYFKTYPKVEGRFLDEVLERRQRRENDLFHAHVWKRRRPIAWAVQ